jgi:hypothetical protein
MSLVPSAVPTAMPVAKPPNPFSSESLFAGYSPSLCIRPAERVAHNPRAERFQDNRALLRVGLMRLLGGTLDWRFRLLEEVVPDASPDAFGHSGTHGIVAVRETHIAQDLCSTITATHR